VLLSIDFVGPALRGAKSFRHANKSFSAFRDWLAPSPRRAQPMRLVRKTQRFGGLPDLYTLQRNLFKPRPGASVTAPG
jgi:hypothetical protein